MKILTLVLFLTASTSFAKGIKTEKSKFELDQKQKLELCQDFADEHFCGSKVDAKRCVDDFEFSGQVKHVVGSPKAVIKRSFKLKSKDHSFEFSKKENFEVILKGGELNSKYAFETYSIKCEDCAGFVPSFIVDGTCKGDGDDE